MSDYVAEIDFREAEVYDAVEVFGRGPSTWSTPALARCAGCRTWCDGPGSWPGCWMRGCG